MKRESELACPAGPQSAPSMIQDRLAKLQPLVGDAVDCFLEGMNNVQRGEWDFATVNLRKLFRNATRIQLQRAAVMRAVREAKEREP
jgi:hypothetical protein